MRPATDVVLDGLSVAYPCATTADPAEHVGTTTALQDVSVTVPAGSATLLTGPSGSGKSTIIRVLCGLAAHLDQAVIDGTARIGDLNCTTGDLTALGAVSGTIFQNPRNQFFTSTVVEELAFALCNRGMAPDDVLDAVADSAAINAVTPLLAEQITALSGGQMQRVACASAMTGQPPVLFLDEPTSNLSADDIDALRAILLAAKDLGATLLIAEHRLYYCDGLVDQVAVLRDGRLDRCVPATEFFAADEATRQHEGLRSLTRPHLAPRTALAEASTAGIQLRDIRFSYGQRRVLNIPSLDFARGEVTALVGPCGAGKSTLARIVAGLEKAAPQGSVAFDGEPQTRRERTTRCAMVMQDVHRQLFAVSVAEELTTGAATRPDVDTDALLAALDLAPFAERHPMSLSGGQKQRVVIGAALAADADVYLFDEPTSGVDYRHLLDIADQLRELAARGKVVVVITHDRELVAEVADRLVTLSPIPTDGAPNALEVTALARAKAATPDCSEERA